MKSFCRLMVPDAFFWNIPRQSTAKFQHQMTAQATPLFAAAATNGTWYKSKGDRITSFSVHILLLNAAKKSYSYAVLLSHTVPYSEHPCMMLVPFSWWNMSLLLTCGNASTATWVLYVSPNRLYLDFLYNHLPLYVYTLVYPCISLACLPL